MDLAVGVYQVLQAVEVFMVSVETQSYAGALRRIAAHLIDIYWLLPRLLITVVLVSPLSVLAGEDSKSAEAQAIGGVMMLVLYVVIVFSMGRWESSSRMASPGKLFMGFTVTDTSGTRISLGRALARGALKLLIWPFFVLIVLSKRQQAPHDIVTGTLMPRLDPVAESRRRTFLNFWVEQTPRIMVPVVFGIITIPIVVGFFILLAWLPRWWAYRKEARRLLFAITEPVASIAASATMAPAV